MTIHNRLPKTFEIIRKDFFIILGEVTDHIGFITIFVLFPIFVSIIDAIMNVIFKNKVPYSEGALVAFCFVFIFLSVGFIMIYLPLRRALLIKHLHKNGTDAKATITCIEVTVGTNEKPSYCSVRYKFKYRDNNEHEGKTGLVPYKNTEPLKGGDTINILYDPKNPKKTIWLEGCF